MYLSKPSNGLINQSLCIAIKEELNEYYRLIAILENLRGNDSKMMADNNNNLYMS